MRHGTAAGQWLLLAVVLAVPLGVTLYDSLLESGPAPDFTVTSTGYEAGVMGDPVTFSLSDYRGQTVVLDFMAVNCGPCRLVADRVLKPLNETHPDVVILSIDVWADDGVGETDADIIRLQQEESLPWRHARDTDGVLQKYGAFAIPQLTVVDPDGRVVHTDSGLPSRDALEDALVAAAAGSGEEVSLLQVGTIGLALLAGFASFFAPCCIGLIPAYMGFLLQPQKGRSSIGTALSGGLSTAAGIVVLYLVLALLFWWAGDALRPYVPKLSPIIAVLLVMVGVLMLAGFDWEWLTRHARVDGRRGFFAFGVGYGIAAFGCTGPVFIPILLGGFLQGPIVGFATFAAYTGAVAGLMVLAALLVATGREGGLRRLLGKTRLIARVSAALMILGGAYLLWIDWQAYGTEMLPW